MKTGTEYDEKKLLQLIINGDQLAFGILYHQYKGLLYIHAYRKLENREDVKDIIHEIFTNLWERREALSSDIHLPSYLYQAVRYKIIDCINRKKTSHHYLDNLQSYLDSAPSNTDYLVREKMLLSMIEREIELLPPKMRRVFELSRKGNLSHKQIALALGITEQSVRSHIKNALSILRPKLSLYILWYFF